MAARKPATPAPAPVQHASLNEALLAIQAGAPALQKDAVNPHLNSRYIGLESLLPQLLPVVQANGVLVTQMPTHFDEHPALRTRLTHVASGEFIEDVMLLTAGKETPQGQGAALTYARRYALMSALGLVAEKDDDGAANEPKEPKVAQVSQTPGAPVVLPVPTVAADGLAPAFGQSL